MKYSIDDLANKAFAGKRFIASEFSKGDDQIFDINGENPILTKELYGKTIRDVSIVPYEYRDAGLGLKFEGLENRYFFYDNDYITVED